MVAKVWDSDECLLLYKGTPAVSWCTKAAAASSPCAVAEWDCGPLKGWERVRRGPQDNCWGVVMSGFKTDRNAPFTHMNPYTRDATGRQLARTEPGKACCQCPSQRLRRLLMLQGVGGRGREGANVFWHPHSHSHRVKKTTLGQVPLALVIDAWSELLASLLRDS